MTVIKLILLRYSSTILDLRDKIIIAFVLGHSNNNELVFKTSDMAHKEYPYVTPSFTVIVAFRCDKKSLDILL